MGIRWLDPLLWTRVDLAVSDPRLRARWFMYSDLGERHDEEQSTQEVALWRFC